MGVASCSRTGTSVGGCVQFSSLSVGLHRQEDLMKAVRKLNDAKKLETNLSYDQSFGDCK